MTAKISFSSQEVQKLTNLTQRQLDYWVKTDFIKPSNLVSQGNRIRREYSFQDLVALRTALRLLNSGLSMQKVRQSVKKLQDQLTGYSVNKIMSSIYLLTDGQSVFRLSSRPPQLERVMTGQITLLFAVNIGKLADNLSKDIVFLNPPEKSLSRKKKTYEIPQLATNEA